MAQIYSIFILLISLRFINANSVCGSIEIKHQLDLIKLSECNIVNGHVSFSNVHLTKNHAIASPLEEISDYLLVYRVQELETLEHIFPNLTIIRGHQLLFDKYSVVVFENRSIRNLGLKSLLKIRRGSILIESNPVLCFADTVNWVYLTEDHLHQHYYLKNNQDPNKCGLCLKNVKMSETEYLKTNCWNLENFQRKKPIRYLQDCHQKCGPNGCTADGRCCSPACLTGCLAEKCQICKDFQSLDGKCLDTCNIPFYTMGDKCVSEKECRQKGLIPHTGICRSKCPSSYRQGIADGLATCFLLCVGNFSIHSVDDLDNVRDCVILRGSLHIELKDENISGDILAELERALGGIKEITGSLKITKSHQLVSLGFFKKLDTIKGDELIANEISFYVVDNYHLEEIWPLNHKVAILKGRIFFHLNPRLCFGKILELVPSLRSYDKLGVKDASYNSNGERVICGEQIRPLYPIIEDVNATAARVRIDPISSSDKDVILGYLHYYKEAPVKNVTMFDGRHGCGRDNWHMDMTLNKNIRHVFANLKPHTQYAYFVKTMTMVDYHMKIDWYSAINYFTTAPMKPGPVHKMYSTPLSASAIIIHWWPPKNTNGVIEKYLFRFEQMAKNSNLAQSTGRASYPKDRNCECGILKDDFNRGPPPNDLNYYNRHQITLDEALPNLIFISADQIRRIQEERQREDNTRRKREIEKLSKDKKKLKKTSISDNASKKNISAEEQEKIDGERSTELIFKQHLEDIERKSLAQQDTGISDYLIIQPKPICSANISSLKHQADLNCTLLEHYEGLQISGETHSYTLENLESDVIYRIFIRACVADLANGCGPEKSIDAETVTKGMEYFLKGP